MEFSGKFSDLMTIAGITNSRLAKSLRVDPSLVSRWRNGSRRPAGNSSTILQIASHIAGQLSTRYHRALLAELIGNPDVIDIGDEELTEVIFIWLNGSADAFDPKLYQASAPLAPQPADPMASNAFAGPAGRQLVTRQLFELFDPAIPNETVLFYSSDPADWIKADIEYRSGIIAESPHLFDNVTTAKLILHNNASAQEIVHLIKYLMPFLKSGIIRIAQIPRYRKELFSNTILIAGRSAAAASHSFAGSSNFMTNLYSDEFFVRQLTLDFNRFFEQCEPVHTIERNITPLDALEEVSRLLFAEQPIWHAGNSLSVITLPPAEFRRMIGATHQYLVSEKEDEGILQSFIQNIETFLQHQKLFLHIPLYGPQDVKDGAAAVSCLPRFHKGAPLVDVESYLAILRNLFSLCTRFPNLVLHIIEEFNHDHTILLQPGTTASVVRNHEPFTLYKSTLPNMIQAFSMFLEERFGTAEKHLQKQQEHVLRLHDHITLLERYLAHQR